MTAVDIQSAAPTLSLADFLSLPDQTPHCELIEGKAVPKVSPKRFHSKACRTLIKLLDSHVVHGELGIEWAIALRRHGQDWVPIPDLLYISNDRLTLGETEDGPCPDPPELAIEIISLDQAFGALAEKAMDYLNAGVLKVWIVDPQAQSFTVFVSDALPITYRGDRTLTDSLFPNLTLIPTDFFRQAGMISA